MLKKSVILGIKSFLIQLKKTNLDTGIKRKPRANKASAINPFMTEAVITQKPVH